MGLDVNNQANISAMNTFSGGNVGKIMKYGPKKLDSIFQEADKNKNGKLDNSEVNSLLREWKMESAFTSEDVMANIDANKDGEISFDEIQEYGDSLGVEINGDKSLYHTLLKIAKLGGGVGDATKAGLRKAGLDDGEPQAVEGNITVVGDGGSNPFGGGTGGSAGGATDA